MTTQIDWSKCPTSPVAYVQWRCAHSQHFEANFCPYPGTQGTPRVYPGGVFNPWNGPCQLYFSDIFGASQQQTTEKFILRCLKLKIPELKSSLLDWLFFFPYKSAFPFPYKSAGWNFCQKKRWGKVKGAKKKKQVVQLCGFGCRKGFLKGSSPCGNMLLMTLKWWQQCRKK